MLNAKGVLYLLTLLGFWLFDIPPGELKAGWFPIIGVLFYFHRLYKHIRKKSNDKANKDDKNDP